MKLLILVHHRFELWNVPSWFTDRLKVEFPEIDILHLNNYEGAEEHLRDAEIVFTISLRLEQFTAAKKLRWVHAPTAAVHQLLFPQIVESDVILTNSTEVHGPVVAEHVIALIFALAKKIPRAVRFQQERTWGKGEMWSDPPRPREVMGATLGLVGVGGIGRDVAKKASCLGMYVVAVREHPEKGRPEGVSEVFSPGELDDVLRRADFVVMAVPLLSTTQGLISAARLAVMKADAYLIKVGRGPQIDEAALAEALRNRKIAGAALDVFDKEPLPAESPLWGMENLLITPHTAGLTEKLWNRHYELFSENLRRYLAHQPLRFVVDKHRGY